MSVCRRGPFINFDRGLKFLRQLTGSTLKGIFATTTAHSSVDQNTAELLTPNWMQNGLDLPTLGAVNVLSLRSWSFHRITHLQSLDVEIMPFFPALLNVSREDFEKSTRYTAATAVQFRELNEGYMASLELFHQIHCLVRQPSATKPSLNNN